MSETVRQVYTALLEQKELLPDMAQAAAVEELTALQEAWQSAPQGEEAGLLARWFRKKPQQENIPQGLYLWGEVGRGKSLLMDMFYDSTEIEPKRRVHYHAFMMDVHNRIHQWREKNRGDLKTKDPIPPLARALASEAWFLCLDEFQVTDVADAMILGRLFTALLEEGVKVVFTSNRKPDDLYLHGLQRDRFLKFIDLVYARLQVLELRSAEDYRLKQLRSIHEVYIVLPRNDARKRMDAAFHRLTHGAEAHSLTLDVQGHDLKVPACYGDVARFSFADLCEKPLGAADYLTLAQEFTTLLLDDIPQLSPEKRNEAKRFVTLIDALYEHKVKLVCSSRVPARELYPSGDGSFEFARTVSRLIEMQSEAYLSASHHID